MQIIQTRFALVFEAGVHKSITPSYVISLSTRDDVYCWSFVRAMLQLKCVCYDFCKFPFAALLRNLLSARNWNTVE